MSVTFQIPTTPQDIIGWALMCEDVANSPVLPYDEAQEVALVHQAQCEDCSYFSLAPIGPVYSPDVHPELWVNMSNTNAGRIMDLLGLAGGNELGFGPLDAEDFLSRVLLAQGLAPADAGVPAHVMAGSGGATTVDCGRPAGYTERQLERLSALGMAARQGGRPVQAY